MKQNIFISIPNNIPDEITETLIENRNIRIERIISCGHSSPKDFWYDQNENEWVILLEGHAKLNFEKSEEVELFPGDYLNIPAHKKHRVEWTEPDVNTIWLAVFYRS